MIMAVFHLSNSNFFIAKYNKRALNKLHKAEPTMVGMIEKGAINKVKGMPYRNRSKYSLGYSTYKDVCSKA
jgi:hypothetical protein